MHASSKCSGEFVTHLSLDAISIKILCADPYMGLDATKPVFGISDKAGLKPACPDPDWGLGVPPPPKKKKNNKNIMSFLTTPVRISLKSQSYKVSNQYWTIIGTLAKCHINGVSLVGLCWPTDSGIWILPPL